MKDKTIQFRVDQNELECLKELARQSGLEDNISAFIRMIVRNYIKEQARLFSKSNASGSSRNA